ncbi:PREDICTED: uncharacterized protein LOC106113533 [Papilio xuthus]|uniref:Uncharacterized protein LOC106113533 n=1 Tax=Papilio xuthus TaxID=66420 RepID=A0AAJ7E402_PAPXU|nr:PREDICTED: uncharacterized protein LOC106113533 [Papilio xuthus]
MPKCRACGKYTANADCIRCTKCTNVYHRGCSGLPAGQPPLGFSCQGCKAKPADNVSAESSSPGDEAMASVKGTADQTRMLLELIHEVKGLRSDLNDTIYEIKQFKADLQACSSRLTAVEEKVLKVEKQLDVKTFANEQLENTVADLKMQSNERDQELLQNDVEIAGLPEERSENALHLASIVAVKLGLTLEERDIVHAERRGAVRRNRSDGAPQQPRPLVVRLARRAQRDAMLRAARIRRGLSTADMSLAGAPSKVYINERLTRTNRQLFGKTREAASRAQWKYVWTKGGQVFTRKDDGKIVERIRTEGDINKIFV